MKQYISAAMIGAIIKNIIEQKTTPVTHEKVTFYCSGRNIKLTVRL